MCVSTSQGLVNPRQLITVQRGLVSQKSAACNPKWRADQPAVDRRGRPVAPGHHHHHYCYYWIGEADLWHPDISHTYPVACTLRITSSASGSTLTQMRNSSEWCVKRHMPATCFCGMVYANASTRVRMHRCTCAKHCGHMCRHVYGHVCSTQIHEHSLYTCLYTCLYICLYICLCTCLYTYLDAHVCKNVCTHVRAHVCTHV